MAALTREDRAVARRARQRDHLVAAAMIVVRRDGVPGFTTAAVAREAQVSKAALFYWFPTKEELLGELFARLLEAEADALVAAVDQAPDGLTALDAFYRAVVDHHLADLDAWRIVHVHGQATKPPSGLLTERVYPASARVSGALEARLRSDPRLHPDVHARRLANVVWASAHGLVSILSAMALTGGDLRHPTAELVDEAVGALTRGARRTS